MQMNDEIYQTYVEILKEELMPAMGCTEPIAIAYCAAKMRDTLGCLPSRIDVLVSPNILKNVKSVKVPHTNGLNGIAAAIAIGVLAGDSANELEVIAKAHYDDYQSLESFINETPINIQAVENDHTLYIELIGYNGDDQAKVVIRDSHTHIYLVEKNLGVIYVNEVELKKNTSNLDKNLLNIKDIVEFADMANIDDVKAVLARQIEYNMAIALEGMRNSYGANIGKTILKYNKDIVSYCKAMASSASDARMNGCELPVIINSGSGNQGITCSVPVICYARKMGFSDEQLYRSLIVSNLCTTHIKNSIGKLSAYCGVVIAGACCGAGISYLEGGGYDAVAHTIVNALAIISGVVCDGAKSSCAAKISSSIEAGFLGYYMYKEGNEFSSGDGIVKKGVENTIKAVGELARVGMCETDKEIIHLMID